ncbi:NAD(P)/FAD-dependent oxidoreductase [Spirosoma sp. KNUC1025]|uniref:FAD-dependent oxidoreductase n=1 Tax=Spirosoma sp. KNUC1025 TaxID=2894082 RepID=UPI00386BB24B|nr:FAD-dependent monooxygenase [Spirosoma sp. KNUC1025]
MLINDKKIAIVGGGPGGLTLARLLQQSGARVNVYERDVTKEARVQGATLDLHEESGLEALRRAGLMEAFQAAYRPGADKLRLIDKQGVIRLDNHESELYEENRPEIDRGPLRKLLLDSLKTDTVIWNSQFVSMTPVGDAWKLTFKNGTSAEADLVIAADGANSRIRPYSTSIKPFYAGITIVEGAVYEAERAAPRASKLVKGGKVFAFGDSKSLIVSAKGDGSLTFYTGCKTDEHWVRDCGIDFTDKAQVVAWFKAEFAGWDSVWTEMIEAADPHFIPRPQYCMPLDQSWEARPNVTMLGDAAHLMPPYAGEGVNMAMLDALELSDSLTSDEFSDCRSAIAHYEKNMRARAADTARMTLESTARLHSPDAISWLIDLFSQS